MISTDVVSTLTLVAALTETPRGLAFGVQMKSNPELSRTPSIAFSMGETTQIVVTRARAEYSLRTPAELVPSRPAFIVVLHLRDVLSQAWRVEGNTIESGPNIRGSVTALDLGRESVSFQSTVFDDLHFYIPYEAIEELARMTGRNIRGLSCLDGALDPIAHQLSILILSELETLPDSSNLSLTRALRALLSHLAYAYGVERDRTTCSRGGLAPWQRRRATEMLLADVENGAGLPTVARHCQLSTSHFVRAFRQTMGLPPHRWLIEQRVRLAKGFLLASEKTVAEIGLSVGYSDQASFTRAFKQAAGLAPAGWRRRNRS
jgi:AraC family transcriptional regulator